MILLAACTCPVFLLIAFFFFVFHHHILPTFLVDHPHQRIIYPSFSLLFLPTASLLINGPIVPEHGLHVAPTSRAGM